MGVWVPVGSKMSLPQSIQLSGAHPASYPMVLGALSTVVKRLGREANHLPSGHSALLVKHRNDFTLYVKRIFQ
jgi:hypothetical protein